MGNRWYVGFSREGIAVAFHSRLKPTQASHGVKFMYVQGPMTKEKAQTVEKSEELMRAGV